MELSPLPLIRRVLIGLVFVVAAWGSAQGYYAGGSVAHSALAQEQPFFFGVQAGYVSGALELRGVLETNLASAVLGTEVMYAFQFPFGRLYLGAGPDVLVSFAASDVLPGAHTVFGGEYVVGRWGFFAETRALALLPLPAPFPSVRLGANVYF